MDIISSCSGDLISFQHEDYERLSDISIEAGSGVTGITGANDTFKLQLEEELFLQNSDFIWAIKALLSMRKII